MTALTWTAMVVGMVCAVAALPQIVVQKNIEMGGDAAHFVVGQSFQVVINVINADVEASVSEVSIADSWPSSQFKIIGGSATAEIGPMGPGQVKQVSFTVEPIMSGAFNAALAVVKYTSEPSKVKRSVASTSVPGTLRVMTPEELHAITYKKQYEYATVYGIAAALILLPSVSIVRDYFQFTHGMPNALVASYKRKGN